MRTNKKRFLTLTYGSSSFESKTVKNKKNKDKARRKALTSNTRTKARALRRSYKQAVFSV